MQEMLAADPSLLNARSTLDESPLGAAAHVGHRAMVQYLPSEGAMLELPDAAMLGMDEDVQTQIDADLSLAIATGAHGIPIFVHAVIGGNVRLAKQLVEHGANTSPERPRLRTEPPDPTRRRIRHR